MNRRNVLQWFCTGIATLCAAIILLPGMRFVMGPILRRKSQETLTQRIAQLNQLKFNEPILFPVLGNRRDAWTLHEDEVIGRVWLVRQSEDNIEPQKTLIIAYSAKCPHLGCVIQMASTEENFICNCHKAIFDLKGQTVDTENLGYKNPSPRSMDTLTAKVVQDKESKQWWVEVEMKRFQVGTAEKIPVV